MIKINRKIEYALMAIKHMSVKREGDLTSAKEVSDAHSAPQEAMARVLQILANSKILKSGHGAQGGYQIGSDLSKVSMLELIEIFDGPVRLAKCLNQKNACDLQSNCNIIDPISVLDRKLRNFYQDLNLKELIEAKPSKRLSQKEINV